MINRDALMARDFPPVETSVSARDAMLYALSVGLGRNPLDSNDLNFVYEKQIRVFPTMAVVLGHPGRWMEDAETGITYKMVVHGAQRMRLHRQIPIGSRIVATNRVADVLDKGEGRGAVLIMERTLHDSDAQLLCTMQSMVVCRADGGFGGPRKGRYDLATLPETAPDISVDIPTLPNAALLYRLNGDYNPLHADPALAAAAGFSRPILHGLCTFGMAAAALQRSSNSGQLSAIEARFSRPVLPGETITLEIWRRDDTRLFRARTPAGLVLDGGNSTLST